MAPLPAALAAVFPPCSSISAISTDTLKSSSFLATRALRATATLALRSPLRFASRIPQALSVDHFATRVSRTLAASYS